MIMYLEPADDVNYTKLYQLILEEEVMNYVIFHEIDFRIRNS
jgi:hypothetical protein